MPRLLHVLAFLAFSFFSLPAGAVQDGSTLILDEWTVVSMAGGKVGYVHSRIDRLGEGDAAQYTSTTETRMRINRLGSEIVIEADQVFVEGATGAPLSIRSLTRLSKQETVVSVRFENGQAYVTTTLMGKARESVLDAPSNAVGPWRMGEAVKERLDDVGAHFVVTTWSTDLNRAADVDTTIMAPEAVMVDGALQDLRRFDSTVSAMGDVVTTSWADADGNVVRTSTSMMGMQIESMRSTEVVARQAFDAAHELSPDVFAASLIASKEFLPAPRSVDRALVRLEPRRASATLPEFGDTRQIVRGATEKGGLELELLRVVPAAGHEGTRPLANPPAELAAVLAPSSMIQSDSELIEQTAAGIVGSQTNAWHAAQAIERWVEANLTDKNMNVAYASALEVCTNRSGDCTEHAVLLCALARASGIPSRVSMGLLYLGGIWGGHAWTEVWIDGSWYALDGTLGRGSVDALHLTVARMDMADNSPATEFANLARVMGEIEIDTLELSVDGRAVDLRNDAAVRIDGDRYLNSAWNLALTKPAGFEFDRAVPKKSIAFELLEIAGKPNGGRRVQVDISAYDADATVNWDMLLGARGGELEDVMVDGRMGKRFDVPRSSRIVRQVGVVSGDALFVFKFSDVAGEVEAAFAQALLDSVDFDLVAAN